MVLNSPWRGMYVLRLLALACITCASLVSACPRWRRHHACLCLQHKHTKVSTCSRVARMAFWFCAVDCVAVG